jgi:hypothetical protein
MEAACGTTRMKSAVLQDADALILAADASGVLK